MKSIFVQIPAYRDFELNNTVNDAINKASGMTKISFGIHNCVLFEGETNVKTEEKYWVDIRYEESIAPKNIGLQNARYIANEMYDREDYYIQIDSHMRFLENWDIVLIDNLAFAKQVGIVKPLITMYPSAYNYTDENLNHINTEGYIATIKFTENPKQFKETLLPSQTATPIEEGCMYTPSVSGGFIFTTGDFAKIKPNRKIAFWGEEPLTAARAFTHGFSLIAPQQHVVSHLYASNQPFSKMRRHHAWADFPQEWEKLNDISLTEYKKIFTERVVGEGALGTVRTLEEYEEFSGLDFRTGSIAR